MILVTGATGNVGREVVQRLHTKGHKVRILTRNPAKASFPDSVDVVTGDLSVPETLGQALDGVEKVFLVRVPGSDNFPRIAKESGVKSIVFLSSAAIESPVENAIGQAHRQTEELILQSGVKWTFLRPGAFMSNVLQWAQAIKEAGVVKSPFGEVGNAPIDPRDIASVAVTALASSNHDGKAYTLTGPEALTPIAQVRILSHVLGKEIRFENIPAEIAEENMRRFAPPEIVTALFALMRGQKGKPVVVLDTVERVTGVKAHTFEQWAKDFANLFQ